MNKEIVFNFFPICFNEIITNIGFCVHEIEGTEEEKIQFLLSKVEEDVEQMKVIDVPDNFKVVLSDGKKVSGLTHERYNILLHNGTEGILYESVYQKYNAPQFPLNVSTMIVDGQIKISQQKRFETVPKTDFTTELEEVLPKHYLLDYMDDDGFRLSDLINSDFFESIRILYNNQKFVSSLKLLMTAIDTFSFLEYGDVSGNFKKWLNTYCDLSKLNITEDELWEYRNSIVHMTNSYSRKVINKKVKQLRFYVSEKDIEELTTTGDAKYFNLFSLILTINNGVENWGESFNTDKNKLITFFERYDLLLSDMRYSIINKIG